MADYKELLRRAIAVLPENNEALADIRSICATPIATGERQFTRWGFKQLLASGGADIIQPDVSHCGGISELKKIATMAEAYDVAVAAMTDNMLVDDAKEGIGAFLGKRMPEWRQK